jgi:hypothetical protein
MNAFTQWEKLAINPALCIKGHDTKYSHGISINKYNCPSFLYLSARFFSFCNHFAIKVEVAMYSGYEDLGQVESFNLNGTSIKTTVTSKRDVVDNHISTLLRSSSGFYNKTKVFGLSIILMHHRPNVPLSTSFMKIHVSLFC